MFFLSFFFCCENLQKKDILALENHEKPIKKFVHFEFQKSSNLRTCFQAFFRRLFMNKMKESKGQA